MYIGKMDKYLTKMEPLLLDAIALVTPEGDTTSEEFRDSYMSTLKIQRLTKAHERSSEAMDYLDDILMMTMKDTAQCIQSVGFIDKLMMSDISTKKVVMELLGK